MSYPATDVPFYQLLSLTMRYFVRVLKASFLFIFIFTLLQSALHYLPAMSMLWYTVTTIIAALISILLLSLTIYRTDAVLRDAPASLIETWRGVMPRLLWVYAAGLVILVLLQIIYFLCKWLFLSVWKIKGALASLVLVATMGIPSIIILLFCYFTFPLLLLTKDSLWYAFYHSASLTQKKWLEVFALYFIMVVILVFLAPSRHEQWLREHHVFEIFSLATLMVFVPILITLMLLVMRNLEYKLSAET